MKRLSTCVLLGVILVSVISAHEVALVVPPIVQFPAFNSSSATRSSVELIDDQGYPGNYLIRGYGNTNLCVNHGDVSLDGDISAGDAQIAFSIVLGTYTPTYEEECAADCTADGMVTAGDAQSIFYAVLGIGECADPLEPSTPVPTQPPTPTLPPAPTGFAYIPPGTFMQGSPSTEACWETDEGPQRDVTISRGFYMMQTEVTRQMWADLRAVQGTLPVDPSDTPVSPSMSHPVQQNTWYESVLFANLMSVQYEFTRCYYKDSGFTIPLDATNYTTGNFYCNFNANGYRLPTEAEWEYACRAGTTGAFSFNEPNYTDSNCWECVPGTHPVLEQYCVYCANAPGFAAVVGSKLSNPWGLYDIHGNVLEWCWDWFASYPAGSVTDPTGPSSGSYRVLRGGCWSNFAQYCRSANRGLYTPADRFNALGFRLLRVGSSTATKSVGGHGAK